LIRSPYDAFLELVKKKQKEIKEIKKNKRNRNKGKFDLI